MRILIAEDDRVSRNMLQATLERWGYEPEVADNGESAWQRLRVSDGPLLAILDWMMPGLDGLEVCRLVRKLCKTKPTYLILLTAKSGTQNLVNALEEGADEFLTKPFNREELEARIKVGVRTLGLQQTVLERVRDLEAAAAHIKHLHGLLPICSYCKKIRDDQNYWQQVDAYMTAHSPVRFSHSVCPECYDHVVKPQLEDMDEQPPAETAELQPMEAVNLLR